MAIRAINTAGTATTGIVVDGVSLGDADAGYTSLDNAYAASANGDTLVFTEAGEFGTSGLTMSLTGLTITADDSVRWSGGAYGNGARIVRTIYSLSITGSATFKNLGMSQSSSGVLRTSDAAAILNVQRCVMSHAGAGFTFCHDGTGGTVNVDNCRMEISVQGGNTRGFLCQSADYAVSIFNSTIVYTSSAGTAVSCIVGNSSTRRVGCANVMALRTNAASTPTAFFNANAKAHPSYLAGHNMSSKTDAPGTTAYQSVLADSVLADVSTLDMRWVNRATAELYPGVDVSASIPDYDADFDARGDEWFVGADWITAAVATAQQPAGAGFFSSFGSFGSMA